MKGFDLMCNVCMMSHSDDCCICVGSLEDCLLAQCDMDRGGQNLSKSLRLCRWGAAFCSF